MNPSATSLSFSELNEAMLTKIGIVHKIKNYLDESGISIDDLLFILETYPTPKEETQGRKKASTSKPAAVAKAPARKKKAGKKKVLKNTGVNYKPKNPFIFMKDGKGYRGVGAKPAWVKEVLAAGGDLEKYRIKT